MGELEFSVNDLPEEFQTMAQTIGLENTTKLMKVFGGTEIYFPNSHLKRIKARRYIEDNFKSKNILELSRGAKVSRATVFNYINRIGER